MAGDLKLGLVLLDLEGMVEGAIQLLDGDSEGTDVSQSTTGCQVLFDFQLHHVALAVEDEIAEEPGRSVMHNNLGYCIWNINVESMNYNCHLGCSTFIFQ